MREHGLFVCLPAVSAFSCSVVIVYWRARVRGCACFSLSLERVVKNIDEEVGIRSLKLTPELSVFLCARR